MAAVIAHIFSECDRVKIRLDGDLTVWINSRTIDVSLTLTKADRDALRKVLDEADAAEDYAKTTGGTPYMNNNKGKDVQDAETIITYKGFDSDLKCRGYQYCDGCRVDLAGNLICCINQSDEE